MKRSLLAGGTLLVLGWAPVALGALGCGAGRGDSGASAGVVAPTDGLDANDHRSGGDTGSGPASSPAGAATGALDANDTDQPLDGPALEQRRAVLTAKLSGLDALLGSTPAQSADAPAVMHERARAYSELAAVAAAQGDARLEQESRQRALGQYEKIRSSYPSYPKRDEVLYDLGMDLILAKDLMPARQALLELIDKYRDSPMVPRAYVAFGDMFFDEAAADPSKLELAKQAYQAVLKYPPPANRVYGYASYKLGWICRNQGDDAGALAAFKRTIEFATQFGGGAQSVTRLGEAARKDLVEAYARAGRPEAAYGFFRPLSGDSGADDARTMAMLLWLGRAYAEQGMAAGAAVVCEDVLRRHASQASCRGCRAVAKATLAAAAPQNQAEAQRLASLVKTSCPDVP